MTPIKVIEDLSKFTAVQIARNTASWDWGGILYM